ncbi:site-specific integrase [Caballeronia novacaledonica]|uniref:phage integrase family protein n=1 Tax=Caballeronia novacaledonica TaxID=1544861 RepID=UPI001EE378B6|nr:phage integrase family protein [Caballeronia novacaledonica]GJH13582.1 site-specific integrase [Caballeronia novacaledonica]
MAERRSSSGKTPPFGTAVTDVADIAIPRGFTTKDFTALRAYVQRIAPAIIARTYYDPDEDPHAATPAAMERYLKAMLDTLVQLALAHGSAALAEHLRASIRQHGQPKLTAVTFRMVTEAAQLAAAAPHAEHPVGAWLRPRLARRLKGEGIATLGELVAFCNRRGPSWWRSIPRIGRGRARAIVSWLRKQQANLQLTVEIDIDSEERDGVPLVADEVVEVVPESYIEGGASWEKKRLTLAPLERLSVPYSLSGADGENRSTAFCYIKANHDLDAVRAYLNRFRDQPKTLRAYTKELERFLLWAVVLRGKALSDLRVDDCEAYKDFLKNPDPRFVGERFARHSPRWRPFAASTNGSASLSAESQRYTVRVLRTAFTWWVDVRYLGGNPWKAVNDPPVIKRERAMQIERALPAALWRKLRGELDARCLDKDAAQRRESKSGVQWRAVRAAILLMGDSGLRREEAANARRENLRPSPYGTLERPVWELTIVGKGQRERTVPVSAATLNALRAHWLDRAQDFDRATEADLQSGPLLGPVVIPWTDASRRRHRAVGQGSEGRQASEVGYTADGLNRLISRMVTELVETMTDLSLGERVQLGGVNAHAFRHTFGTQSVADEVPVDVVQKVLGHASLQTTTIYVQAEKQRVVEEVARYYAGVPAGKVAR